LTSARTSLVRPIAVTLIVLIALASAACSGASGTPTPIGEGTLDEQVVERLLTKSDIDDAGGATNGLDRSSEDILAVAALVGLAQVDGVEVWLSVRFQGDGRPGLLLSVKRLDDVATALGALDRIESGGAYVTMADPIGDHSAVSSLDPAIGAALSFVVNRTLITLQLPVTTDGVALLDDAQLANLGETIASRL
jgi:hypothetical protein